MVLGVGLRVAPNPPVLLSGLETGVPVSHPQFEFTCQVCCATWAMVLEPAIKVHGGETVVTCCDCGARYALTLTLLPAVWKMIPNGG